jgi:hypothetical protein
MKMIHRFVDSGLQVLADRQFRGVAATSALQDDGWSLDIAGANLDRAKGGKLPFIDNHDAGNILGVILSFNPTATTLPFLGRFSSEGVNPRADLKHREMRDGVANFFSVGFGIDESVPYDPKNPYGPRRATKWTLYELSLATVPVDSGAIVTARARRALAGLKGAMAACDRALDEHRAVARHQGAMGDALERLDEHRRTAGTALRAYKQALDAQDQDDDDEQDPETAIECQDRCRRSIDGMGKELKSILDRHTDAMETHVALKRAMGEAETAFGGGYSSQTSAGTGPGTSDAKRGRRADYEHRQRQMEALALAHPPKSEDYLYRQRQLEALALGAAQS